MGLRRSHGKPEKFCCDFRYLNVVTIKDAYPIPRIDESLSKLGDAKFFTTLDLGSAFWQVPLRKQDREKTGFACELGLFQWKWMPWNMQCDGCISTINGPDTHKCAKKHGNLIRCYVDDVEILEILEDTNPGGPYRETGRGLYLHETGRPEM